MIGEPIRERMRALDRRELVGLAVIAALIVGAAGVWYVRSLPRAVRIEAGPGPAAPAGSASAAASTTPPTITVDVAGWVLRPGVYEFHAGDRVVDAIRRAGGARPGADLTSLNLAALLVDSEQIVVGRLGHPGIAGGSGTGTVVGSDGGAGLININTATLDELETLPGIGPSLGQRIIDYRTEHGPFRSVDDLLNVSGIGDKRLDDIRPKVTV